MKISARAKAVPPMDLADPRSAAQFRKAAKLFTIRATKTKAAARQTLVGEGIYTKAGKLTKHYA